MAYCTEADLTTRYGAAELIQLTDRADPPTGTIDGAVVTAAITAADAEIDSYLAAAGYTLPLSFTVARLKTCSAILARHGLHKDRMSEVVADEAARERAWLRDLATGAVALVADDGSGGTGTVLTGAAKVGGPEPRWTRDSLTGY
jgi:phage gp36-like protein